LTPVALLFLLYALLLSYVVIAYFLQSSLYFYNLFSYLAIEPQVCNKLDVSLLNECTNALMKLNESTGVMIVKCSCDVQFLEPWYLVSWCRRGNELCHESL